MPDINRLSDKIEESEKNIARLFTGIEVIKESLGNIAKRLDQVLDVRDDVTTLKSENESHKERLSKLEDRQLSLLLKVAGVSALIPIIINYLSSHF